MEIKRIDDFAAVRRIENIEAGQSTQDGLIAYVACMADVELPEDEPEQMGGPQDE